MTVTAFGAEPRLVAKVAHAEVLGIKVLAGKARLDLGTFEGILGLLQVLDRKSRHQPDFRESLRSAAA